MDGSLITTIASIVPDRAWGIAIPNYFWFTGSSAAAFIISSFAHVFGIEKYKPIAGFSLLLAFVLLLAAPFNLIDDLSQPGRVSHIFLYGWENFASSPMKWGVLLLIAYPVLILFEALFLYRAYFVKLSQTSGFIKSKFYRLLSFGRTELSEKETKKDHKIGFILGAIGIPLALSVHGYTGYILGVVHANVLWNTPLMPILFLASAMVSGTGLLIVLLPIFQKFFTDEKKIDFSMISHLAKLLSWFIVIDLVVRALWLSFSLTFNNAEQYPLLQFFTRGFDEIVYVEYILCLFIPMIIGFTSLRKNFTLVYISGFIVGMGVWLFRWNTVIGGQEIARTTPGFFEYVPHLFGQDSIISVLSNWSLFIAILAAVMVIFPWDKEMSDCYKGANNAK